MGKFVVSVTVRQEISSLCKLKLLQIDPEGVERFGVFVVFEAISVQFPQDYVISSNTIINERTTSAKYFLKRLLQRLAKILQNDSKYVLQKHFIMTPNESKKFKIFTFFCNLCF